MNIMPTLKNIYLHSPFFIKKAFANVEALRRDRYRKFGDYRTLYDAVDFQQIMTGGCDEDKGTLIRDLLARVSERVEFYRHRPKMTKIEDAPFLSKDDYIANWQKLLADGVSPGQCWRGRTSGSTGKPLSITRARDSIRTIKMYQEKYFDFLGIDMSNRTARISGILITPFHRPKPPYWVYISRYRQLQMSGFHISPETAGAYLEAMKKHRASWASGYASAWLLLAGYLAGSGVTPPEFRAIVTDSDGIALEQQRFIEKVFGCPVRQTYGLAEVGQVAVQCLEGHYHVVTATCHAEIVDEENNLLPHGQAGEIVLTSLVSAETPFIRYKTGDIGVLEEKPCPCGWRTQYFSSIEGRTDDYVVAGDGQKRLCRLSMLVKSAKNILESQIIQERPGEIKLLVVPARGFKPSSMSHLLEEAQKYLGDIVVTWQTVDRLERTDSAKLRSVVRKFQVS